MTNTIAERESKKPIVSIVVPVYNVERYLDTCVESLVAQTLGNIEIILVDDGSTDSSPSLCDAWAKRDSRISVIHKQNGGLSDARNCGIAAARGSYIGLVDSDDHVDAEMYEQLLNDLVSYNARLVICGVADCYENSVHLPNATGILKLDARDALKLCLLGQDLSVGAACRLYEKSLFDNIRFPLGRAYEDAFTFAQFILEAQTVVVDYAPLYHYEHREGTITTRPYGPHSLDIIDAYDSVYESVVSSFPDLRELADFRRLRAHFVVLDSLVDTGVETDRQTFQNTVAFLRENCGRVMGNQYFGKGRKLAMCALMASSALYGALRKAQRKKLGFQKSDA